MDRDKSKMSMKRSGNKAKPLHMSDFIALGSKASSRNQSVDNVESKAKAKSPILSASNLSMDRKDIVLASSSTSSIPSKRLKTSSASMQQLSRSTSQSGKESKSHEWDCAAIDIDVSNFFMKVLHADDSSDDDRVEALLCGAVKKLKTMRAKPDPCLYLGLQYLVKCRPTLFCNELIVEALCSLLKRDISVNFKTKGNNLVSVLAANILMAAYREESSWPELFVKIYIEDSLGERIWVDSEYCKGFVENILTAFNTKAIPKDMMAPERLLKLDNCPNSPSVLTDDDETSSSSVLNPDAEGLECVPIYSRFQHNEQTLAHQVLEVIRDQMARRQPTEISRNTLRFLVSTCGLCEVRLIAAQKLEIWIQNPKLMRPAQELMLAICLNCNLHNQQDIEVISLLVKTRIKAKPIVNHYLTCMKELLNQNPDNLSTLLKHAVYNELSSSRNTNIMQIFPILFQHAPEKATKVLGDVFLELLLNKEDFARSLRNFLRELSRLVRNDFSVSVFCLSLLHERKDSLFNELEQSLKERVFLMITDFIVFCAFISVTPSVKEQYAACTRGERKDVSQLRYFQMQVATITRDAIWWLHTIVPKAYKPGRNEFHHSMHKILFMEQLEHYHKDIFPSEGERMLLLRIASDIPLLQDTLMRIMVIGLSRDHPLSAPDALELADQLVKRAALVYSDDFPVLDFDNPELCDIIFNLCTYHYPENISLPQGYHPPNLAISDLYWKAWKMLLVIVSHNPRTFGDMAWKTYPMLRNMMEMCITNQFVFPPPTLAIGEKAEEIKNRELQMSQMEKDRILLFETHLAAASTKVTITEANSLLLSKLISMDPHGPARRLPIQVMDQLKQLNAKLKLGELLCHSRSPDFLLDIIQRQGTSQSMPWLSELVESSASSFNMLPIQCLCEFLINETGSSYIDDSTDERETQSKDEKDKSKKKRKQEELLFHLQKLLHEPDNSANDTIEIINYFMKRLSSQQASSRNQACRGLQMVLSQPNKSPESDDVEMMEKISNDCDWLLKIIPSLPHFNAVRSQISLSLRQACQIENDPPTIAAYVTFLATNTPDHDLQDFADLALDMAQMIVERPTIVNTILLSEGARTEYSDDFLSSISEIFFKYLNEAKSPSKEVYSWSESQDQIRIHWQNGEAATMHILVVHAMIIVLTYGPPQTSSKLCFEKLLDNWFPKSSEPPKAFLVDTSEEALLIPDWLKLRMIRSSMDVLVDAALKDLDPCQLVLFIQSFGIPVLSMSKLLKTLDVAVEFDSFAVDQAVLDKSYMSQLVEVQHNRGATGGDKFAKLLVDENSADVVMESPSTLSQTRVIQRAPPKLPTPIENSCVSISVLKLFGLDTSSGILSAKQEYEIFKGLQKALSQDILTKNVNHGATSKFVETCERVLSSDLNTIFIQSLHRKSSYSAALLRLATATQRNCDINKSHLAQRLVYICHQILHLSAGLKSSLLSVATQFYNKHKPHETKKVIPWKGFVQQNKINPMLSEDIIKTVQVAENHDTLRLEEVIHYFVECAILNSNTKPLISAMTNITFRRLTQENALHSIKTFNRSKFCFFVDWLECLNRSSAMSVPQPQCELLFSLIIKDQTPLVIPFRPYLLALLLHQSGWGTLRSYINMVLNPGDSESSFDPSSVLDFLDACIHVPKIWQGKYKKKCRRDIDEDVLALNKDQMVSVLNYILQEAAFKVSADELIDSSEVSVADELNAVVEIRLPLLMKCLASRKFLIYHSVKHLCDIMTVGDVKSSITSKLLLHLYLHIPSVTAFMPETITAFADSASSHRASYSAVDVILHTLFTSLAKTEAGNQCLSKMRDIDLICRKIASAHPVLLLRQLPMIPTLLRCRVQFEFSVFQVRNHLTLFTSILGLLELLPPYLFRDEYKEHLHDILSLYMEVFQTFGPRKKLDNLMNHYFALLLQYLNEKPISAKQFVIPFRDTLQELSPFPPELEDRPSLVRACLHHCGAPGMLTSQPGENFESKIADVFASDRMQRTRSSHLDLQNKFPLSNSEDVSQSLSELENISSENPLILEQYKENIKTLIQDGNSSIRNSAFNLMMLLLKHNPKCGTYFVSSYLQCMDSSNRDVINTALEHFPKFVILVQEHAHVLLQKAFNINMLLGINTTVRICETFSLLTMQSGC